MFRIKADTHITGSADIPLFSNERMLIDPDIWSAISGDISVVWIILQPEYSSALASSHPEVVSHLLSESDPNAREITCNICNTAGSWLVNSFSSQVTVFVHKDATFRDVRLAICQLKPELHVECLYLWESHRKVANHEHVDGCRASLDAYSFGYNPDLTSCPSS